MEMNTVSEQVRRWVAENDQRQAADILLAAFRGKNTQLTNLATVQHANIKKLADHRAAGILSNDEYNIELAKINAALLHLADEHARLHEQSTSTRKSRLPMLGAMVAIGALIFLAAWWWRSRNIEVEYPESFDIEVRLHEPGGEHLVVKEGSVNLRLGDAVPQEPRALDAGGRAVFRELSSKFRGDSLQLLYFPERERRFRTIEQSAATASGQNQTIRFTLAFIPDTTLVEMTLYDAQQRRLSGALVTIDGTLQCTTDNKGYFRLAVPKASGQTADFVVEKNGKRLFKQDLVLAPGMKSLPLE